MAGAVLYTASVSINHTEFNAGDMFIAAGTGAVAGALIGTGIGAGAGVALTATLVSGGVGMAAAQVGYTAGAGADYSSTEMVVNTLASGVTSMATGALGSVFTKGATAMLGKGLLNAAGNMLQTVAVNGVLGKPTDESILRDGAIGFSGGLAGEMVGEIGKYFKGKITNPEFYYRPNVEEYTGYVRLLSPIKVPIPPSMWNYAGLAVAKTVPLVIDGFDNGYGGYELGKEAARRNNQYVPLIAK